MSSMRAALKQLSSESLVYGLGQVSGRAVQLLLVPVLTRVLLQQEYGVSDLVFAYLQTVPAIKDHVPDYAPPPGGTGH